MEPIEKPDAPKKIKHIPRKASHGPHNCMDYAIPYKSDGPLGHGWECGKCGMFLQAG
jgi:hypothetical protein